MVLVDEKQYNEAVALLQEQNGKLKMANTRNDVMKADLATVCNCFGDIAGLLGDGGFSMAAVMKLVQQKDTLAEKFKPMGAVLEKYTTKQS